MCTMVDEDTGTHEEVTPQEPQEPQELVSPPEQEQLVNSVPLAQEVRTEGEKCNVDQNKRTSGTDQHSDFPNLDPEMFFKLLVECQSRRMDDQRVSLNLLPGLQVFPLRERSTLTEWESEQLYNMIRRAQSSRMEDQRCTPPQIIVTPGTPVTPRKTCSRPESPTQDPEALHKPPPRSSSFSPVSALERTQHDSDRNNLPPQGIPLAEQERLLALVAQALRGRMDDQRCFLDPNMRTPPSPKHTNVLPQGLDTEQFFKLIAHIQSRRLDDQRVQLDFLPGIQTPVGNAQFSMPVEESEKFCNIISRVQGPRMDDQRCYAPHIQLGSPAPNRKVRSTPSSTTHIPPDTESPSKASNVPPSSTVLKSSSEPIWQQSNSHHNAQKICSTISSITHIPNDMESFSKASHISSSSEPDFQQSNSNHTAQTEMSTDQDRLFSMVYQAQTRRMEDQRCALERFRQILTSHKDLWPTLDTDQLFALVAKAQSKRLDDQRAVMPSIQNESKMPPAPKISVTPGSPETPRRASCSAASPKQDPDTCAKPPPRSASFSPVSERERMQYDGNLNNLPNQLTFQVSVCLTPRQVRKTDSEQCSRPDVFLKIGQPGGEACVIPLSPLFCGPAPLDPPPQSRNHHSRSSSPRRCHHSTPNQGTHSCLISPEEDYFSFIERVHTAQLRKGIALEKSRENRNRRGKGDGRREKKSRGKRK